jgi:uncharacterized membrane-anchored protein
VLETSAFRLRWERHTEFSTYTIFVNGAESEPFSETAIQALPSTWLPGLPGELLAAMHVSLVPAASIEASIESLGRYFHADSLAGSECAAVGRRVCGLTF